MEDWQPDLYNRIQRYRAEPVAHILARLALGESEQIADLGCGSGENTLELARRSRGADAVGIDRSPAMIEAANKLVADAAEDLRRRVRFELGEIERFRAARAYSVIFSNATFHWISDQRALFAACFEALQPRGRIVVQMPANNTETGKAELTVMAREEPWANLLGGLDTAFDEPAAGHYAAMLREIGYEAIDCYHHTFDHPMDRSADVVEWYRSTGLRPFLARIPAPRHEEFLDAYRRRLERAYGTAGPITFTFRRLFIWARRPAA
jgi:trans-aconitate 2-methyltransferase